MSKTILILGGNGLLGQALCKTFANEKGFDTYTTIRAAKSLPDFYKDIKIINDFNIEDKLDETIKEIRPKVIINTIANKINVSEKLHELIEVNAIFPHRLYDVCKKNLLDFMIIHMSTDAVFSGKRGSYSEKDSPDTRDLYGLTKLAGELRYENCLTIRTSIYGRDVLKKTGLFEWFLNSKDEVEGYANVYFSGVSTKKLSEKIKNLSTQENIKENLLHYPGQKISKYELLKIFNEVTGSKKKVAARNDPVRDLSLTSIHSEPEPLPSHEDMVTSLLHD